MNICRDCKHSKGLYCTKKGYTCRITGTVHNPPCTSERSGGKILSRLFGLCGKEGRFFEETLSARLGRSK